MKKIFTIHLFFLIYSTYAQVTILTCEETEKASQALPKFNTGEYFIFLEADKYEVGFGEKVIVYITFINYSLEKLVVPYAPLDSQIEGVRVYRLSEYSLDYRYFNRFSESLEVTGLPQNVKGGGSTLLIHGNISSFALKKGEKITYKIETFPFKEERDILHEGKKFAKLALNFNIAHVQYPEQQIYFRKKKNWSDTK